jgi:hypothetical protein
MATFNKFNSFVEALGRKVHNLNADVLKVALSNTLPVAANSQLSNITQIAAANGYVSGGNQATGNTYAQAAGVAKLTAADVTFTAAGGSIATFQYAILYNDTATNKELLGWADYGAALVVTSGNSFVVDFDQTNGIFTNT